MPAVIDKDWPPACMARQLKAEMLIISTAVEKVCLNFGNHRIYSLADKKRACYK